MESKESEDATIEDVYLKALERYLDHHPILSNPRYGRPELDLAWIMAKRRIPEFSMDKCIWPPSDILNSGKFADVVLVVNGREYKAHKLVLSGFSPVFDAMFSVNMAENISGRVEIGQVRSEVFERALEFIYTRNVDPLPDYDFAKELVIFANKVCLSIEIESSTISVFVLCRI